jgi:hypothetical protein
MAANSQSIEPEPPGAWRRFAGTFIRTVIRVTFQTVTRVTIRAEKRRLRRGSNTRLIIR